MMNHRRIERVPTLGRTPPFLVEDIGDLGAIEAFPAKVGGARRQRRVSAERREARHRARQFVRCAASAMPMAFDAHLFRAPHDLDQDPFEQQARDGLALGSNRGLGSPERRQILRQLADRRDFGRARRLGIAALQTLCWDKWPCIGCARPRKSGPPASSRAWRGPRPNRFAPSSGKSSARCVLEVVDAAPATVAVVFVAVIRTAPGASSTRRLAAASLAPRPPVPRERRIAMSARWRAIAAAAALPLKLTRNGLQPCMRDSYGPIPPERF